MKYCFLWIFIFLIQNTLCSMHNQLSQELGKEITLTNTELDLKKIWVDKKGLELAEFYQQRGYDIYKKILTDRGYIDTINIQKECENLQQKINVHIKAMNSFHFSRSLDILALGMKEYHVFAENTQREIEYLKNKK